MPLSGGDQFGHDEALSNPAVVPGEPLIEGLQRRIKRSREVDASRAEDLLLEVAIDLEHVAQLVGAGEAKAAICVRFDGVVLDDDAEALRELLAHLIEG